MAYYGKISNVMNQPTIIIKGKIFFILLAAFAFVSCEGIGCRGITYVSLINLSNKEVAVLVAGYRSGFSYPDTLLADKMTDDLYQKYHINERILDSAYIISAKAYSYKELVSMFSSSGFYSTYIFDQHDVDSLGWKAIFKENNYIVRYDLTAKDLNRLKGRVFYPPTKRMKEVRMFPTYETWQKN